MTARHFTVLTVAVGLVFLLFFCATAGVAQLRLMSAATDTNIVSSGMSILYGMVSTFEVAVVLIIASGIIPGLLLRSFRVRAWGFYVANVIVSAALASYAFLFIAGMAMGQATILVPLPKNGRDMSEGMVWGAPPFVRTLTDVFLSFPRVIWNNWMPFCIVMFFALVVAIVCVGLFWLFGVHRRRARM
jgi:hypothetical protein